MDVTTLTVIDLASNGVLAGALWWSVWHVDRRLFRLEGRVDDLKSAGKKEMDA